MYDIEWLDDLPVRYKDPAWIEENAETMHEFVDHALKAKWKVPQAVDALLLAFPHLIGHDDLRRWIKLLRAANKIKVDPQEQAASIELEPMQQIFVFDVQGKRNIAPKGKRRPRVRTDGPEVYENYLNLLLLQVYRQPDWLTPERIDDILAFARVVNDPRLYHKTYQLIAYIYNTRHDFDRGLDFARLSYNFWRTQDQNDDTVILESALSLFAMAVAYNGKRDHQQALRHLDQAADLFAKISYERQYGIVAQETGHTLFWLNDYERALQWFEKALAEYQQIDDPLHIASALQDIGMVHGLMGDAAQALAYLNQALGMWIGISNPHNRLETLHTLAYVEAKSGQKEPAVRRLEKILADLETFPESKWKTYREKMTNQLIEGIQKNEDLDRLMVET